MMSLEEEEKKKPGGHFSHVPSLTPTMLEEKYNGII